MPKSKEPSLQNRAFEVLLCDLINSCNDLSRDGSLNELSSKINAIKKQVINKMPPKLCAEFCQKFLFHFYWIGQKPSMKDRPASHYRAVLEIIMDREFFELTCGGPILRHLLPEDANRIRGLKILDFSNFEGNEPILESLKNFHLQSLEELIFPHICTNFHLEMIGLRCPKLRVLRIEGSENVTDQGLRALSPCCELRVIDIGGCSAVTDNGINELLDVHKKLEEFNIFTRNTTGERAFDILLRPISAVCPSVKHFALENAMATDLHLRRVVGLFPNLTYLQFRCSFTGDLRILKNLKNLTRLDLSHSSRDIGIEDLKELLLNIGDNISQLILRCDIPVTQNDLNFIFETCGNIEYLHFSYKPIGLVERLVIPPFGKLHRLECIAGTRGTESRVELEFSEMFKLEILYLQDFENIYGTMESIILDNGNFPILREIGTFYVCDYISTRLFRIPKTRNLDVEFKVLFNNRMRDNI